MFKKRKHRIILEKLFSMDEVIVSTAFNKIQSQNVMKVEHSKASNNCNKKELQP